MANKILLIDFDSKLPNLALMKISTYYKQLGWEVELTTETKFIPATRTKPQNMPDDADIIFCSVVFTRNKAKAAELKKWRSDIEFGGTGWDLVTVLPPEVSACRPDYELYTAQLLVNRMKGIGTHEMKLEKAQMLVDSGIGFTSRGCVRQCEWCFVPPKEGKLRQDSEISEIINPRSNKIILLDNNFTSDPNVEEKLHEIRDRKLVINISQGIDVRLVNEDIAKALSEVKLLKNKIYYAWDQTNQEKSVFKGINILSKRIRPYRHNCYILIGYKSTFEEDYYRYKKLTEAGIDPYAMLYNEKDDVRLKHFARWINGRIYKVDSFEDYTPWVRAQKKMGLFVNDLFVDTMSPSIAELQMAG